MAWPVYYIYAASNAALSTPYQQVKGKAFDINSKVYLAMVNAGMGPTHVTNFLSGCNIPPVDPSTLRKKEKLLAPVIISAADKSCEEAQREEQEKSTDNQLECSFDAGWQKRGSGWQYNSTTGHASLIGAKTGKIITYDVRNKICSICRYHNGRKETVPFHECNINWTGSSKGMEPDMATQMVERLASEGCSIGTIHADNDSTTRARLHASIEKKDDRNHVKKNLSKRLYAMSKQHKQLKTPGVIPYISRCFMYAISNNQSSTEQMKTEISRIVPHMFGDHDLCSSSWCKFIKDPENFRYQHLPNGKPLTGDKLRDELQQLTQHYLDRADKLLKLGSTQSNESFNNSVASKAPKNRSYGGTKSLKARVSAAVMQKNVGHNWLSKVNEKALLSPDHLTQLHGIRKDKLMQQNRLSKSSVSYKKKRLLHKVRKTKHDQRESLKEGDTYGPEIEVADVDTDQIPSKIQLSGSEPCVVFDLETTGLSRQSDVTQIAAFDGDETFNQYVTPNQPISSSASAITGLTFNFDLNQMFHDGNPVESSDLRVVLLNFIDYLRKKNRPILFGHNIATYDVPILCKKLQENNLLSEFLQHICGCVDTLHISKRKFKKEDVGNYKQQTLISKCLGKQYNAHDAAEDVTSLYELLTEKLDFSSKDVFHFATSTMIETYNPLVRSSHMTKAMARKLAQSGIFFSHLALAWKRDRDYGIQSILSEHGFSKKTAKSIETFFRISEE